MRLIRHKKSHVVSQCSFWKGCDTEEKSFKVLCRSRYLLKSFERGSSRIWDDVACAMEFEPVYSV